MIEQHEDGGMTITGDSIELYRLITLMQAIKLEIKGLKFRGGSVTARVKREFGFKGNRQKVLDQLTAYTQKKFPCSV